MPVLRRFPLYFALLLPLGAAGPGQDFPAWHRGALTLKPSGFLDVIGLSRSATATDSISTAFGSIPLSDSDGQSLASVGHSRVMLKSDYDFVRARARFSTYLEADFLNPLHDAAPWHWRQYWSSLKVGSWEILGGKGWSLLRPNRDGVSSDSGLMNTDVLDPAYEVGIAGARRRQVRVMRRFGRQSAAAAWQSNGDFEGKWALDARAGHFEAAAISGHGGRRAVQLSTVANLNAHVRLVSQQYLARRALNEALSLVANGVDGFATLQGVEWQPTRKFESFSYAGFVRSHHSAGNRIVQQYTAGCNWRTPAPALRGVVTLSLQYSYVERALWDGRSGGMHYVMSRMRFSIP